jgi:hypothetical protein
MARRSHETKEAMLLNFVFDMTSISRRAAMPILAGVAAVLTSFAVRSTAAGAQAAAWREYRDDEMGFRVEMPGEFRVRQYVGETNDPWIKETSAKINIGRMSMQATGIEYRGTLSVEEIYKLAENCTGILGKICATREERRTVSGMPAREYIREADDTLNFISRMVVVGNRVIGAGAYGERSIHGDPTVRRVLDSLTLLQGGR